MPLPVSRWRAKAIPANGTLADGVMFRSDKRRCRNGTSDDCRLPVAVRILDRLAAMLRNASWPCLPAPVPDFRQIVAVGAHIVIVLIKLAAKQPERRCRVLQSRHPLNGLYC